MVFKSPEWVPELPQVPDTVPICDFVFDEKHGRLPIAKSLDPYTCGLTGATYSASEYKIRSMHLARALAKELGWAVNQGSEYDKVAALFVFNSV